MSTLKSRDDYYEGVVVDAECLPSDVESFSEQLRHSLQEWRAKRKRGVWLKLPAQRAALLPAALAEGFDFHHARPGYVVVIKWLPQAEPCTIPESILYSVGIGAFVLNMNDEVLLVQEANGPLKGKDVWKLPTGLVEAAEDIPAAAEREVLEETGVAAAFDRVLAVRQSHGLAFGRSDIFFVCALRIGERQAIKVQQSELVAADWHPLAAVGRMPIFASGMFAEILGACQEYARGQYSGFRAAKLGNTFSRSSDLLLHGNSPLSV